MIEGVDMRALRLECILHVGVEGVHVRLAVHAAGDAGLVGDDNDGKAGFVEHPHGFRRACDPVELVDAMGVAVVDIEHAIAVEKGRRPPGLVAAQIVHSVFRQR